MTRPSGEAELRPVLVTVDDDPSVSRAVARDLRRRYAERNRIVRAESGEQALDALRQMKLRGEQVAILLADYRMPGLNGIEFLERAMDVYPYARRVLLTAYADTSAAIDAINIVDVDHYLLKPWDPPEEKLYPVIDDLLRAWQRDERKPVRVAKLVGHRWSAPSTELRDFLARNQVPYRWYAADSEEGKRLLAAAGTDDKHIPMLITTEGEPMIAPSHAEVAARVGLATTPEREFYDLVVVGGGGRARRGGLRRLRGAEHRAGGEVRHRRPGRAVLADRELPGLPRWRVRRPAHRSGAAAGGQVRRRAADDQARRPALSRSTGPARTLRLGDGRRDRREGDHPRHRGVAYRQLNAPGCAEMTGAGVYYGAALSEAEACKDAGRVRGGRGELGRAGPPSTWRGSPSSVTMLVRGGLARGVDVVLPHPADRRHTEHLRPQLHRGGGGVRQRAS